MKIRVKSRHNLERVNLVSQTPHNPYVQKSISQKRFIKMFKKAIDKTFCLFMFVMYMTFTNKISFMPLSSVFCRHLYTSLHKLFSSASSHLSRLLGHVFFIPHLLHVSRCFILVLSASWIVTLMVIGEEEECFTPSHQLRYITAGSQPCKQTTHEQEKHRTRDESWTHDIQPSQYWWQMLTPASPNRRKHEGWTLTTLTMLDSIDYNVTMFLGS